MVWMEVEGVIFIPSDWAFFRVFMRLDCVHLKIFGTSVTSSIESKRDAHNSLWSAYKVNFSGPKIYFLEGDSSADVLLRADHFDW
jgi:hypothetical protein